MITLDLSKGLWRPSIGTHKISFFSFFLSPFLQALRTPGVAALLLVTVARWEQHPMQESPAAALWGEWRGKSSGDASRTHAVEKPPRHWWNPTSPSQQLLNKYRGKACLCGQEWQGVPEATPTPHRANSCCFRGGLGRAPGLSPLHGWSPGDVTTLQKDTGFWHMIFYVEASGGYDMQGTHQIEFLVLPWLLYYVKEAVSSHYYYCN